MRSIHSKKLRGGQVSLHRNSSPSHCRKVRHGKRGMKEIVREAFRCDPSHRLIVDLIYILTD